MKVIKLFTIITALLISNQLLGQLSNVSSEDRWGFEKKHYIGTQAFMIMTAVLDPSPEFYQLNYGYRLSPKDEISIEAITWRYSGPLGRPLGPDFDNPNSDYPGDVKSLGLGLAYKRFLWKGVYTHIHSTALQQTYRNQEKQEIQKGFMLFNTIRLGYHFKVFNNRIFLAPSMGATFWPVNTNLPEDFQVEEDKWAKYLLGEVGFHVGYNF